MFENVHMRFPSLVLYHGISKDGIFVLLVLKVLSMNYLTVIAPTDIYI